MLKIITVPNSILTIATKKVERFDGTLRKLVKEMDQTLRAQIDPQGVGLAAPQIGERLALFIIRPTPESKTEVFVNPRIMKIQMMEDRRLRMEVEAGRSRIERNYNIHPLSSKSTFDSQPSTVKKQNKSTKLEGCLSIPKIWGTVKRADKMFVEFQDLTGKNHKKWFSGFKALVIQHEVDHLKGILFTQRAIEQNAQLFEEKEGKLEKLSY